MRLVNIYSPIEENQAGSFGPLCCQMWLFFALNPRPCRTVGVARPLLSLSVHTSREAPREARAWRSAAQLVVKSSVAAVLNE